MKKMIDKISLPNNATIAVAVSGGKDSACLLHLLKSCEEQFNIKIKAVNVDHSIRGQESVNDSLFVRNLCQKLGVELMQTVVDAVEYSEKNKISIETAARILRYEFFDSVINSGFADFIATAHHKSDNFETMLLNLFRGSGVTGLTGIPYKRAYILRPLLEFDRREIEEYIEKNELSFVEDKSNFEDDYSRNYLRLNVIPKILEKFPSAQESAYKTAQILKEEDEFLNALASKELQENDGKIYLPTTLSPVLYKRSAKLALIKAGVDKDYEKVHFDDLLKLTSLQTGSKICLPKGVVAVKEYDKICIFKEQNENCDFEYSYKIGEFNFLKQTAIITQRESAENLVFDGDKIPKSAVIRTRKKGDVFTKFGGGTKKLKEYLIDKKIPLLERNALPLLAVDNEVLLIFGVEISDKIKVDDKTKNKLYAHIKNR